MDLKDVFKIAHETGKWPMVEIAEPLKHMPSNKGRIKSIKPTGVSVDFGGKWNPWFWATESDDGRSKYMKDLKPCDG